MSKKLLFIVPIFPKDEKDDTIVPFIFQFSQFFLNQYKYIDIDVISTRYPRGKPYTLDRLSVYPVGGGFRNKLFSFWIIVKAIYKGLILSKNSQYAGILSFWYGETAVIGNVLSTLTGTKHFIWMQGQDVKPNNKYLKLRFGKPKNIITVGTNHQQLLKKHWNINGVVANVAVDPNRFPKLNTGKRAIDVIGVGNLSALKNYSLFVDLIFELKKTFKNINTIICGDGEEMEMLSKKIKKLNLTENITLKGYISNKEVRELLNNSYVLLHTSNFEGNSLVIQEALFSGCQVVSRIPLGENVEHFYFENNQNDIVNRLTLLLNTKPKATKRIRPFKIEDTSETIHSLFFS